MDISKLKIFNLMQTNMEYLGAKQDVLAQNVSNANTPGYKAKGLKPLDFKAILNNSSAAGHVKLQTSSANHIAISSGASGMFEEASHGAGFETSPTGNEVVLEEEMIKVAKNSAEYQQTTNIYRKMLQMIKTSLGENA